MDEFVYANESRMVEDEGLPADLELELQKKVKALGLGRRISCGSGAEWESVT